MGIAEGIQIGTLIVLFGTLVIVGRQSLIQNKLLIAQLLRDRFEMYWKIYEPITSEHVAEFKIFTEDFMDGSVYSAKYEGDYDRIRKYLGLMKIYEYLAFTHNLEVLNLPDPLGYEWTHRWTRDLLKDETFRDVHRFHGAYYQRFSTFVETEMRKCSNAK